MGQDDEGLQADLEDSHGVKVVLMDEASLVKAIKDKEDELHSLNEQLEQLQKSKKGEEKVWLTRLP